MTTAGQTTSQEDARKRLPLPERLARGSAELHVFVGSVAVMLLTAPLWARMGGLLNNLVLLAVPAALTFTAQAWRLAEGKPWWGGLGWLTLLRPRRRAPTGDSERVADDPTSMRDGRRTVGGHGQGRLSRRCPDQQGRRRHGRHGSGPEMHTRNNDDVRHETS